MPVSKRIACPLTLTWQVSLLIEMTSSTLSGVSESETSVAMRSPTLRSRSLSLGPISATVPSSMPPEPVSGLWCLPRLGDDAEAVPGHLLDVAALGLLDLREAGRVDVERVDVDEDLVVVDLHRVVDLPRRLRQDALGLDDPVGAELVAFLHPCSLPSKGGRRAGGVSRSRARRSSGVVSWADISPLP